MSINESSRRKHSVIILGAGMAGIKTGIDLHQAGIDSIILEARDRLGGRLFTCRDGLGTYDFGASWFHDALTNPLFAKAQELGNIDIYFDDGKKLLITQDGYVDENLKLEPIVEEMAVYSQLVFANDPTKKDVSLHTLAAEYVWNKKHLLSKEQIKYAGPGLRCFSELWHGISWDMLSAKYAFSDSDHLGRNAFVKSGYDKVFQNELKDYPIDQIYKNYQVESIERLSSGEVCVTSTKNEKYYCDYLVVTIPQTILKLESSESGSIKWFPPLPETITSYYPTINYSSLGKVFFEFDKVFWPKDVDRFFIASKIDSIINQSIETNSPPPNDIPHLSTNYKLKECPRPWEFPSIVINYDRINNKPVLIALTQAPLSEWFERHPETAWEIMKPAIAILSNKRESELPKPNKVFTTAWSNDEFIRGSYGTLQVGDDFQGMEAFIKGLPKVRFAGAETIHGSANGCAHGAWLSGQREAAYIIDKLKPTWKL